MPKPLFLSLTTKIRK